MRNTLFILLALMGGTGAFAQTPEPPASPAPPASAPPAPTPPAPAERPSRRLFIGPEVGFYFPSSGRAADAFGKNFFNIGLGVGKVAIPRRTGEFRPDISVIANSRKGSNVFIIPAGLSYQRSLAKTDTSYLVPYYGATANLIGVQMRSEKYHLPTRFTLAGGASVFTGLDFGQRGFIEARYLLMNKVRGMNLSGLGLSLGYRF